MKDYAARLKCVEGKSWRETYKLVKQKYGDMTNDRIRNAVRRHPLYHGNKKQTKEGLQEAIYNDIQKGATVEALTERHSISERVLRATLADIEDEGYQITEIDGKIQLYKKTIPLENRHTENWQGNTIIRFGVVSDTHLCNKWQQLSFLKYLYDVFEREGINTVYHAGDITDGYYKHRPGHVYELFRIGADEQAEYTIQNYPYKRGIITKFITGNHDHTHILNGGHDIGKPISNGREDMVYLGQANAKVSLTPNCMMEINHPLDGTAYALSYPLQKYIDSMSGGEKPNILLNGHHHKGMYIFYRNVHGYECGCVEAQTPYMKGKRIPAHMGGWIIQVEVDKEGSIIGSTGTFYPLYRPVENDY